MARYAEGTSVPIPTSKAEIEALLTKYGATSFVIGWAGAKQVISFEYGGRRLRFSLQLPGLEKFKMASANRARPAGAQKTAMDAEHRRLWRSLVLCIKAKLEAVESGVTSFEDEFLAYTVMPNNETVGEWAHLQLEAAYNAGNMPPLLPGGR